MNPQILQMLAQGMLGGQLPDGQQANGIVPDRYLNTPPGMPGRGRIVYGRGMNGHPFYNQHSWLHSLAHLMQLRETQGMGGGGPGVGPIGTPEGPPRGIAPGPGNGPGGINHPMRPGGPRVPLGGGRPPFAGGTGRLPGGPHGPFPGSGFGVMQPLSMRQALMMRALGR